jgi:hypothetical protein
MNVKLIGVYSSRQNAEMARERAKAQPGFRDYLGIELLQTTRDYPFFFYTPLAQIPSAKPAKS